MPYFYVLKCSDGSYYIGSTRDLVGRLDKHRRGVVKYTKSRLPVELICKEYFRIYSDAFQREQQVKSWKKRRAIENLIKRSKIN